MNFPGPINYSDLHDLLLTLGFDCQRAQAGDLVVMLGAGSIGSSGPKVLEALRKRG